MLNLRRFTLQVEDRTLLKILQMLKIGEQRTEVVDDDQSIFESRRVTEPSKAEDIGKRMYFERLGISDGELKVSLLATGKLSSDLLRIKKSVGESCCLHLDYLADDHI